MPAREALPHKGFGGCATKVDKSKKCRTPFLKQGSQTGRYTAQKASVEKSNRRSTSNLLICSSGMNAGTAHILTSSRVWRQSSAYH